MNNSIALPRLKVKKRKPMGPLLLVLIFNVVFNPLAASLQVYFLSTEDNGLIHLGALCLHIYFFTISYPLFLREWKAWWNGD